MASLIARHLSKAQAGKGYAHELLAAIGKAPAVVASADPSMIPAGALPPPKSDAEATPPPAKKGTGYGIQIGALPNTEAAERVLKAAQSNYGEILDGLIPVVEPYKKIVRARFAGFADRKAAQEACEQLRKQKVPCLTLDL
jgi:cell division septation protein DedD